MDMIKGLFATSLILAVCFHLAGFYSRHDAFVEDVASILRYVVFALSLIMFCIWLFRKANR